MGIEEIESCAWKYRNRLCPAAAVMPEVSAGRRRVAHVFDRNLVLLFLPSSVLEKGREERDGNVRACQSKGCLHASLTFPSFLVWLAGSPTCTLRGTNQRPTMDQPGLVDARPFSL
jgi:hypothetical protein